MNNRMNFKWLLMLSLVGLFGACSDVEDPDPMDNTSNLNLSFTGLEDLGPDAVYEGWLIVNGSPVTTGTFTVDENGMPSMTAFEITKSDLENATMFVLTIEPANDPDPAPSDIHILAGEFNGTTASLSIDHSAALNNDFMGISGTYILATPTDTVSSNEESGIWFLDNSSGSPEAGLDLPTLPAGWAYEGWAVINGVPVSTGTFTKVDEADAAAPFSGSMGGPPFPGEDFLNNAPSGLSFPTDLRGGVAVISIEPVPDNSPMPFVLKPLVGAIDENAATHTALDMTENLSFPTGEASR